MIEAQVRREMLRIARLCYERNLLVAMDGNLSVRLDEDRILATKAGCHKGMLRDEDLVVIDRRGNKLSGEGDPTSEMASKSVLAEQLPLLACGDLLHCVEG